MYLALNKNSHVIITRWSKRRKEKKKKNPTYLTGWSQHGVNEKTSPRHTDKTNIKPMIKRPSAPPGQGCILGYLVYTCSYRKGTSIRQAPVFRHLGALRKSPWTFIIWMNELQLHCMLLVSYIQQYFNTSITVLTNQVWKLLIALLKMPNTGAFTVHVHVVLPYLLKIKPAQGCIRKEVSICMEIKLIWFCHTTCMLSSE